MSSANLECALAECTVEAKLELECSSCEIVKYCCEDHQRVDLENHKKVCSSLTLETSPELGRHYVASRDLKAGSLLISESPVLVEPRLVDFIDVEQMNPQQLQEIRNSNPMSLNQNVCLACCVPCADKKCPKCDWPICSIECSKAKIHAENECPIFVKLSFKMTRIDPEVVMGVFIIRAMVIKKTHQELWEKIQGLQSEAEGSSDRRPPQIVLGHFCKLGFLLEFQKLAIDFGGDLFDDSEMGQLFGSQLLNSFAYNGHGGEPPNNKTYRSDYNMENNAARILYLKSSIFSHGCFPNCFWSIGDGPDFKLEIRTSVDISKGQVLSIAYYNVDYFVGSMERYLSWQKGNRNFNCFCDRCIDPTELNSLMSAVKCKIWDCQDGYLIPKEPKNVSPSSIWECFKCGDKSHDTWEGIKKLTARAVKMIKKFQEFEPKKIEELLIILRKHLHPNHYVIQQFCHEVVHELDKKVHSDTDNVEDALDYNIGIMKYLLQVFHVTMPGLNHYKFLAHVKLCTALHTKFNREDSADKKVELTKELDKVLDELLEFKKFEPLTKDGECTPIVEALLTLKAQLELESEGLLN